VCENNIERQILLSWDLVYHAIFLTHEQNVSILSVSYSLKKKNTGSGGGVTSFRDQAQTCTGLVHVISRLMI